MEGTKLHELKKRKEPTGCDSCGLARGLAIREVKSLKIDKRMLEIVIYSAKRKVADKRNSSALQKRGVEA